MNSGQLCHCLFPLYMTESVAMKVTFKSWECHHSGHWQSHQCFLTCWRTFLSSRAGRKISALWLSWPYYSDFWQWAFFFLNLQGQISSLNEYGILRTHGEIRPQIRARAQCRSPTSLLSPLKHLGLDPEAWDHWNQEPCPCLSRTMEAVGPSFYIETKCKQMD